MMDNSISACGRCGGFPNTDFAICAAKIHCNCGVSVIHNGAFECIEVWNAKAADYRRDGDREKRMVGEQDD